MEQILTSPTREPMAAETKFLLESYPRTDWSTHPGFAQKTQGWLNAHQSFRALATHNKSRCESWLAKELADDQLIATLGRYGNMLVQALHGHHHWEDHSFFPEIFAADARAERGIEILESDHEELDGRLEQIIHHANRAIKLATLSPNDIKEDVAPLRDEFEKLEALLARHLSDEEELIVPVILHHRLRG